MRRGCLQPRAGPQLWIYPSSLVPVGALNTASACPHVSSAERHSAPAESAAALQLYSMGPKIQEQYARPTTLWLPWTYDAWSTGAYLINRQGMRKVRSGLPTQGHCMRKVCL